MATVNNLGIVTALVSLPLTGAWHADIEVSPRQGGDGTALSGAVTLELDGLTLTGTVLRSQVDDKLIGARITGGNGGLSLQISERYYKGSPTVRAIVEDILRDAGEVLASDSSPTVLSAVLNTWQRAAEPAGEALSRLLASYGASWRVKPDGSVLIVGSETWPTVEPAYILVPGSSPAEGFYRIAWRGNTPADVLPGITFLGRQIRYVVHELRPDGMRTELRFVEPRSLLERMRALISTDVWYAQLIPGIVEKQNADGSVDVVVENRFGLTQVPLRSGVPGLRVLVGQGQQVLVGFEQNDPRKPFAALWGQSGNAKFGTLAFPVALAGVGGVPVLIPPAAFFEPTSAGDAALAAWQALNPAGITLPVTTGTVKVV